MGTTYRWEVLVSDLTAAERGRLDADLFVHKYADKWQEVTHNLYLYFPELCTEQYELEYQEAFTRHLEEVDNSGEPK